MNASFFGQRNKYIVSFSYIMEVRICGVSGIFCGSAFVNICMQLGVKIRS